MHRSFALFVAALALAVPAPGSAQTAERATPAPSASRRSEQRATRARERARERAEQRERERRDARARRGSLDTTVTFDARGTVIVNCPGGDIIVTGRSATRSACARAPRAARSASPAPARAPRSSRLAAAAAATARFEVTVPGRRAPRRRSTWSGSRQRARRARRDRGARAERRRRRPRRRRPRSTSRRSRAT